MKDKLLIILRWALLLAYLIIILGFTGKKRSEQICTKLSIQVIGQDRFISEEIVENLLITNGIKTDSSIIDNLNFDEIEKIIEEHPSVKSAKAFSDFEGNISIKIIQRTPVLRIITNDNQDFYLDTETEIMPLSENYTAHVTVLSGNISSEFVSSLKSAESETRLAATPDRYDMNDILMVFKYIYNHELWKNQIVQIYINEKKEIELIPRLGNHLILIGYPDNYKYKLEKLETLYEQKITKINWDSFYLIDLRYSDQVIFKKRS